MRSIDEVLEGKMYISVGEFAKLLGISKPTAYKIVESSDCEFTVIKIGSTDKSRILINVESLLRWYRDQQSVKNNNNGE